MKVIQSYADKQQALKSQLEKDINASIDWRINSRGYLNGICVAQLDNNSQGQPEIAWKAPPELLQFASSNSSPELVNARHEYRKCRRAIDQNYFVDANLARIDELEETHGEAVNSSMVSSMVLAGVDMTKLKTPMEMKIQNDLLKSAKLANGTHFVGEIKTVTVDLVIQDVGRGNMVAHILNKFDKVPDVGAVMELKYGQNGRIQALETKNANLARGGR